MALSTLMAQHDDCLTVTLAGELDFLAAPGLLAAVSAGLPEKSPRLVLDVGGVTLCDSLGLEALLDVQRTASSRGGSMELAHVNGKLLRVLGLAGLDHAFMIVQCGPRTGAGGDAGVVPSDP